MAGIFSLFGEIFIDNTNANKEIDKTTEKADSAGSKIGSAFGSIAKGAVAIGTTVVGAASVLGTAAYQMASDAAETETSFAKVKTLLSGTDKETQEIFNSIKSASIETGVAVTDFSEAVYGAISASVDQNDAVAFTANAIKLAKGGFTDTAIAVDVLTTAINAYGLSAEEATDISDMLITTQNLGKTTVNELASSMGQTIPVANSASTSLDDLSTQYAVLTKNGVATAQAGTQIKAMLGELSKTGSKADEALRGSIGKSFAQLQDEGYNTSEILNMLSESAAANNLTLKDMFGSIEAGSAALTLVKDGGEDFNTILSEMRNSAGATEAAYETMSDTFEESFGKVKNAFKVIKNNIGEALIPTFKQFAELIMEKTPQIQSFIQRFIPIVTNLISLILPPLFTLIETLLPTLFKMMESILPILGKAIEAILPIIVELLQQLLPPLLRIIQMILPVLSSLLESLMPLISPILGLITAILNPLFELLEHILPPLCDFISLLIVNLIPLLQGAFEALALEVNDALSIVFNSIKDTFDSVKRIFKGVIDFVTGVFTGNWRQAWNGVVNIFKGIINLIPSIFERVINSAIWVINGIIDGLNWTLGWTGVDIGRIPNVQLPRFRIGLEYVPYDDYPALLHKGERVLTESEADEYKEYEQQKKPTVAGKFENPDGSVTVIIQLGERSIVIEHLDGKDPDELDTFVDKILEIIEEKIKRKGVVFK